MITAWLEAWQTAERGRFVPWLPVFMGTGVLTYFALRTEPPFWLGIAIALPAACAVILLRRHLVPRAAAMALAATAIGFTVGSIRHRARSAAAIAAIPRDNPDRHRPLCRGTRRGAAHHDSTRRGSTAATR